MKCPNCGFNTFEYAKTCKKCGSTLKVKSRYKTIYEPFVRPVKEKGTLDTESVEATLQPPVFTSPDDYLERLFEEPPPGETRRGDVLEFDLAGFTRRAVAFLIDLAVLFGTTSLTLAAGLFFADADLDTGFMNFIVFVYLVLLLIGSTYFVFLQGFRGRTIGKMFLGIRIIRDDGEPIGFREAFIRWVGYFISMLFLFTGFFWALFDSRCQTWHDKFAGTYVVRE